jgi:hypothetical protein
LKTNGQKLAKSIRYLLDSSKDFSKNAKAFASTFEALYPAVVAGVEGVIQTKDAPPAPDGLTDQARGEQFLVNALLTNKQLKDKAHEWLARAKLSPDDLAQIGKIVSDINAQSAARSRRILQYLTTLYQIRVDLLGENVRHSKTLAGIAAMELDRWQKLAALNAVASAQYRAGLDQFEVKPDEDVGIHLFFSDEKVTKAVNDWYRNRNKSAKADSPDVAAVTVSAYNFAPIRRTERVLSSLRKLAETARRWHEGSPNEIDPSGRRSYDSSDRLTKAIETLNANLLILSFNEDVASQNEIRLARELAEHQIHLDGFQARATEAGILLGLGNQLAFHQTGITDSDLQAFIGITQSVLLGVITSKVH